MSHNYDVIFVWLFSPTIVVYGVILSVSEWMNESWKWRGRIWLVIGREDWPSLETNNNCKMFFLQFHKKKLTK